jgi:hypothetical protein
MDNYFNECPPMMNDGRLLTDYRSSQIREEIFKYRNCARSENEARTMRIENADSIMDEEWNHIRKTRSCYPNNKCFHQQPTSRVTTLYNNAELLAYNQELPAPKCILSNNDFRLTNTRGYMENAKNKQTEMQNGEYGYPIDRCPRRCNNTDRLLPDNLYYMDGKY